MKKIALGLAALLIAVAVAGIFIARSDWLREKVRVRIVSEIERSTGGNVEIRAFRWDWKSLTAELDDVVLHGTEPVAGPPLLRVKTLAVGLKIVSLWKRDIDIASLRVEEPKVYLLIAADGSTNVANPKIARTSQKSGVETVLDLKIAQFAVDRGAAEVHAAGQAPKSAAYDFAGENVRSNLVYEAAGPDYRGTIAVAPLRGKYGNYGPIDARVRVEAALLKNLVRVDRVLVETAHSRVEASGMLENFAAPSITADFKAAVALEEVKARQRGVVDLEGSARYSGAQDYRVQAKLHARDAAYAGVRGIRADSALDADPHRIELTDLRVAALGGAMAGKAEIRGLDAFEVSGRVEHLAISRAASLTTTRKLPYDGVASGPFELHGKLSDTRNQHLSASATLAIAPSGQGVPVRGEIVAKYAGAGETVTLDQSYLALPSTRLDVSGVLGQELNVHLESRNVEDLQPAIGVALPVKVENGALAFDGAVSGKLDDPRISGRVTGRNFTVQDQPVQAFDADVSAGSTGATVSRASLAYRNLRAKFEGSAGLRAWKLENDQAVRGSLTLENASIADLAALAGRKGLPAAGTLNATAQIAGTFGDPRATATLDVAHGSIYGEPFDRLTGKLNYTNNGAEAGEFHLRSGARQLDLTASYQHARNSFLSGKVEFQLASNQMMLDQFQTIRKYRPGVAGTVQLKAAGDVVLSETKAGERMDIGNVNADLAATSLTMDNRPLGNVHFTARTEGQELRAHLENDIAQAVIRGDANVRLDGDYPGTAQITFAKVDLGTLQRLLMPPNPSQTVSFGGSVEGRLDISGPAAKPAELTARLEIPRLEVRPVARAGVNRQIEDFVIRNSGAIHVSLNKSIVRVENARFEAKDTDLTVGGLVNLNQKAPLDLRVNGRVNLAVAKSFAPDLTSSGSLAANATIRGSWTQPQIGGQADLRDGNFSVAGLPNGFFHANGRLLFDGARATIDTLTGETGGGTVKLSGFAAFGGPGLSFHLGAAATGVRVRYPEGVSSVSDANLDLTGTSERSVLSGEVTVEKISYNPQSDLGSLLSLGGSPSPTDAAPTGLLAGMQLDVKLQTSPDITFQTGLVQDLETEANLRLRGTLAAPALLGRVLISQGSLTFFGNKYTINEGVISFFNPVKIDPIINIDLETKVRGVDVTITIAGPANKRNVTFSSDPPLQYADIIGLLATGKTPSDPTIAARQTDTQQSWEQMGANALVGQAIANPVAGRLQRFFGVSRLKIDPLLPGLGGGGSSASGGSPGARLSIEQQITPNVVFDYVVNTTSTTAQLVRVEWDFSKHWSAVMLREENSAFGIDFLYKKRLK